MTPSSERTSILITGGSGFVGWNAVRHLTGCGNDVVATFHTLPHYLHQVAGCQAVRLDLADGAAIDEVVARFQPRFILHAAALARPQRADDPELLHRVNVEGTAHMARAASRHDSLLVYLSTDLVFPSNAGRCTELSPVAPSGAGDYAESKLQGESAVKEYAENWIIIRPTLMFGDGTERSNSFTQFIDRKWERGERAPLFTDQYRSFLYVDDLISAVERVVGHLESRNQLYLCGGDETLSRGEFGLRYADACRVGRDMCHLMTSAELDGYVGGPSIIALDTSKLRSTGWGPTPLAECFKKMQRPHNGR